jgi:hypothetical protein
MQWHSRAIMRSHERAGPVSVAFHVRTRMLRLWWAAKIGGLIEWLFTGGHPAFFLALVTAVLLWLDRWALLVLYASAFLFVACGEGKDTSCYRDAGGPHEFDSAV